MSETEHSLPVYVEALLEPLLNTIVNLSLQSMLSSRGPNVYVAYEDRDTFQYDAFIAKARKLGLRPKRISNAKVRRAVAKAFAWQPETYKGIIIIHMRLHLFDGSVT